jgi:hypothetical protein
VSQRIHWQPLAHPDFWKALATARKWEDANAWRFHWHRFIDLIDNPGSMNGLSQRKTTARARTLGFLRTCDLGRRALMYGSGPNICRRLVVERQKKKSAQACNLRAMN